MRTLLKLSYDGAPFCGWQVQPQDRTVQGDLDHALSTLLGVPITTMGAGRTDTGVHAKYMVAHFDSAPIEDHAKLCHRLNRFLDPAIHIISAEPVHDDFHSRFDALSRSYEYLLCTAPNPFLREKAWVYGHELDFDAMNAAAAVLLEVEDFASFCKAGSDNKTTICNVTHAGWRQEKDHWVFTITADRFLRNQVRATVGSLIEVGRGKWTVDNFAERIAQKDRSAMGTSAPAHGLYLSAITYPENHE